MARDGSGIYSAPAGTTATAGTTIESAKYNAFVNDLVTDANTARPIVAGGTGATTAGAALAALGGQPLDAGLTSIAGLTTAADRMIYTTAADVYAVATLTAAGRALLDDADAAAQRTTLGLGALATAANVTTAEIAAATLVTASETIASNNNNTTIPTSAAVLAHNITLGTAVATTSGTSVEWTTIPSWAKRVTLTFAGVSLSGTDSMLVQVGNSGGYITTGYVCASLFVTGTSSSSSGSTSGFFLQLNLATRAFSGSMTLTLHASGEWMSAHNGSAAGGDVLVGGGRVSGAGTVDRVRVVMTGSNTFDAGSVNISWE